MIRISEHLCSPFFAHCFAFGIIAIYLHRNELDPNFRFVKIADLKFCSTIILHSIVLVLCLRRSCGLRYASNCKLYNIMKILQVETFANHWHRNENRRQGNKFIFPLLFFSLASRFLLGSLLIYE